MNIISFKGVQEWYSIVLHEMNHALAFSEPLFAKFID